MLLRGELRKYAKNSNFENFESPLYSTSVSMPLTWKSLNGIARQCLSNPLVPYKPTRALRSSDKHLLVVPRTLSSLGDRAFAAFAPSLWNSLPLDIRCCDSFQSFKNLLKTHLHNKAYIYWLYVVSNIINYICMFELYIFVFYVCASE